MLSIRPATTNDQAFIIEAFETFMNEVKSENPQIDFTSYIDKALQRELTKIDSYYLKKSRNAFFIAELDKLAIGTVGFEEISTTTAEIRRLMVSTEHRRKGIGKVLMLTAEAKCAEYGYSETILETSELQPASIALYEELKYTKASDLGLPAKAHKGVAGISRYRFRKKLYPRS